MYYLLILSFVNGDVDYVGPFKTHARASEYGLAASDAYGKRLARWHIVDLITSHHERFIAREIAQ